MRAETIRALDGSPALVCLVLSDGEAATLASVLYRSDMSDEGWSVAAEASDALNAALGND